MTSKTGEECNSQDFPKVMGDRFSVLLMKHHYHSFLNFVKSFLKQLSTLKVIKSQISKALNFPD